MVIQKRRFFIIAMAVLAAALALPALAHAGGWAVITLDRLPHGLVAGQPYALRFMARQHGQSPWQVSEIQIEARHAGTGQKETFAALPDEKPGHYQAELLFPRPGRWEWGIASGMYPDAQPMPALVVADGSLSGQHNAPVEKAGLPGTAARLVSLAGLLAVAAGLVIFSRGRGNRGLWLSGAVILLLSGGLALALLPVPGSQAGQGPPNAAADPAAGTGQQLFLAKGCVICHINTRALDHPQRYSVEAGPNLSTYRNDPVFLSTFLKDPQDARPGSKMPNLELSEDEIAALIAFINEEED